MLRVAGIFYAVKGFICICPPTAFSTFIIVENCGLDPSDNDLYKLGLLIPVSSAILVSDFSGADSVFLSMSFAESSLSSGAKIKNFFF